MRRSSRLLPRRLARTRLLESVLSGVDGVEKFGESSCWMASGIVLMWFALTVTRRANTATMPESGLDGLVGVRGVGKVSQGNVD
jgi:hypothetical protein